MHLQSLFRETKCEFCVFDYFYGGNQSYEKQSKQEDI